MKAGRESGHYRETPNERAARYIVSAVLGCQVDRYEDGRENSQVDALIRGVEDFPLEVVEDRNPATTQQWVELRKRGHRLDLDFGGRDWHVTIESGAIVRDVFRRVPHAIAQGHPLEVLPGVIHAESTPTRVGEQPHVRFSVEATGQFASRELDPWLIDLFTRAPDLAPKLRSFDSFQRHLFVWATVDTEYSVIDFLEDDETPLPEVNESVPDEITHLWVASVYKEPWLLRWSRELGWERVAVPQ